MHDPVEKYTPGRRHDGTIHVWIHPSVVGNSFGGKMGSGANPRVFPRVGLLSAWCHADL